MKLTVSESFQESTLGDEPLVAGAANDVLISRASWSVWRCDHLRFSLCNFDYRLEEVGALAHAGAAEAQQVGRVAGNAGGSIGVVFQ